MEPAGTDNIAGDDNGIPNDLTLENRENAPQTTILYRLQIGEVVSTIPSELDWRSLIPRSVCFGSRKHPPDWFGISSPFAFAWG